MRHWLPSGLLLLLVSLLCYSPQPLLAASDQTLEQRWQQLINTIQQQRNQQPAQAITLIHQTLPRYDKVPYHKSQLLMELGVSYFFHGDSRQALEQLQQSLQLARRYHFDELQAHTLKYMANIAFYAGQLEQADNAFRQAKELLYQQGLHWEYLSNQTNYALLKLEYGQLTQALELLLDIPEKVRQPQNAQQAYLLAGHYNAIAMVLAHMQQWQLSRIFIQATGNLCRHYLTTSPDCADPYLTQAFWYAQQNQWPAAMKQLQRARNQLEQVSSLPYWIQWYRWQADLHFWKGDYSHSLTAINQARKLTADVQLPLEQSKLLLRQAENLLKLQKPFAAVLNELQQQPLIHQLPPLAARLAALKAQQAPPPASRYQALTQSQHLQLERLRLQHQLWQLQQQNRQLIQTQQHLQFALVAAIIIFVLLFLLVRRRFAHLQHVRSQLTQLEDHNSQLARMARIDALTGLYSRRHVDDVLQQEIERCKRKDSTFSVLLIDADHFKRINDRLGHDAGDTVLSQLARRIKDQLRSLDIVGRWGGEEFIAVLTDTSLTNALTAAENLRNAIASQPIVHQNHYLPVTVSIGVAQYRAGEPVETLLKRADLALYKAKASGRNCVQHASSTMSDTLAKP